MISRHHRPDPRRVASLYLSSRYSTYLLAFLTEPSKAYQTGGGIGIQLFNSIYLLIITMIISFPISLGAGIYLSEYAGKNWLTDIIRTSIEILSSVPSVVVGLFGFLVFVIHSIAGSSIISGAFGINRIQLAFIDSDSRRIFTSCSLYTT